MPRRMPAPAGARTGLITCFPPRAIGGVRRFDTKPLVCLLIRPADRINKPYGLPGTAVGSAAADNSRPPAPPPPPDRKIHGGPWRSRRWRGPTDRNSFGDREHIRNDPFSLQALFPRRKRWGGCPETIDPTRSNEKQSRLAADRTAFRKIRPDSYRTPSDDSKE